MKKIYSDSHRIGRFKYSLPQLPAFMSKNYGKLVVAAACLLILLFSVSGLLVISGSNIDEAVARSERQIEVKAGNKPAPPSVSAASAIMVDGESGRVLYEKNAHEKLPVASTTKIMTALVVRDQLDMDESITIEPESSYVGEQGIGVVPGESLTSEDLLWAMLVYSANDAAHALAKYTTGSTESFVSLMNTRAEVIGATDTHFVNPHGLDAPGHYSTAYDLAIMGRELKKDPLLSKMVAAGSHKIPGPPGQPERVLENLNDVLSLYGDCDGIKTGYTSRAGWCLVASAERGNKSLVVAVLNSASKQARAVDVTSLFDYGFDSTERILLARGGEKLGSARVSAFPRRYVSVVPEKELAALSIRGSGDVFDVTAVIQRKAPGGVKKGTALGTVEANLNGASLEQAEAVAADSKQPPGPVGAVLAFVWYTICWMGKIISAPFRIF